MTRQLETFKLFIPRLKQLIILNEKGDTLTLKIEIDSPGILPDFWNILKLTYDSSLHQITWTRIDGNLKQNNGKITISGNAESGSPSGIDFEANLQAGAIVPQFLLEWGAKKFIFASLTKLVRQLEQTHLPSKLQEGR